MIRDQISAIVASMTSNNGYAPNYVFGTVNELNLLADDAEFPVVFQFALQPITFDRQVNTAISNSYSIYLEFLYKTEFDQFTSQNEVLVNKAVQMANEFLVRLSSYRPDGNMKYFKTSITDKYRGVPIYNKYDVNSTGISLTMDLKTLYNDLICIPTDFNYPSR